MYILLFLEDMNYNFCFLSFSSMYIVSLFWVSYFILVFIHIWSFIQLYVILFNYI